VAVIGLCVAMVLALVALFWAQQTGLPAHLSFFDLDPDLLSETFFKVPLRPWRIVAFASTAIMAYTMVTYLWRPLRRGLGWLLLPLGQAALYCYIVHFFLILAVLNLVPLLTSREIPIEALNPAFQLAIVAVLWLMVRKRVLFGIVPN
jgi:hypothetical protein